MQVLAGALPRLLASLSFSKSMRWQPGSSTATFSRPLRWLLALHGANIVPFEFAGVVSGRTTRTLRNAAVPRFPVRTAYSSFACSLGLTAS